MTAIDSAIYAMGPIFAGPTADGTNGQVLVTNGSKQLSFTTIASGVSALNSLTGSLSIAVGTSGSDVAVSASGATVTVNIPDAGSSARGVVTTGTQTIAGAKTVNGSVAVVSQAVGTIPLVAKGAASQSADLQEWQNSSGTVLAYVGSGGIVQSVSFFKSEPSQSLRLWFGGGSPCFISSIDSNAIELRTNNTARLTIAATTGTVTATAGISAGPVTFAVLNATTATATLGEYRITDRGNRLAYPDGTNWRFVSDDAIIS